MTKISNDDILNRSKSLFRQSSMTDPLKFLQDEQNLAKPKESNINPKTIYRQGDILFKKVRRIPLEAKQIDNKVIAEGEVTGHAHVLVNGAVFEVLDSESRLFIKSSTNTKITHNEHLPIKLEPGEYEVIRQREYLGPGIEHRIVLD